MLKSEMYQIKIMDPLDPDVNTVLYYRHHNIILQYCTEYIQYILVQVYCIINLILAAQPGS